MREILFRGKTKNSGRWAYGDLVTQRYNSRQGIHIYEKNDKLLKGYQFVRIEKKTLGQFTGFTDKINNKIFEYDIVKCTRMGNQYTCIVEWMNDLCGYHLRTTDFKHYISELGFANDVELIGNIFDNPELLGERNDNNK